MSAWLRREGDDLVLAVRVQPRASRTAVVGPEGERLRVRVSAPPADGRANAALAELLAEAFGVPRRQVEILAGAGARDKRVRIVAPRRLPAWARP
ncbi:DUF167 family protein [Inmirania thermothiophila]|uniref:UPF0235 protein EDC57_0385 n=1 Tax=Inmirania thermothiophila TaxID=1750597 RepID=A0A3N1YAS4_9GAMM|nr:DUF167 family protein [Inmirania thermothiophila]ROR34487.1 hypothetical protein EDC57_0385 [Inmirania thermothiophila]